MRQLRPTADGGGRFDCIGRETQGRLDRRRGMADQAGKRRGRWTVTDEPSATNAESGAPERADASSRPYVAARSPWTVAPRAERMVHAGWRTSYSMVDPSRWRV